MEDAPSDPVIANVGGVIAWRLGKQSLSDLRSAPGSPLLVQAESGPGVYTSRKLLALDGNPQHPRVVPPQGVRLGRIGGEGRDMNQRCVILLDDELLGLEHRGTPLVVRIDEPAEHEGAVD